MAHALTFSGGMLAGFAPGTFRQRIGQVSRGPSGVYAFWRSPDGSVEALARQNSLEIRDARTRQLLLNQRTSGWHLVFSPDSKRFAVATRKGIEVSDIDSKQLLRRFHEDKDVLDGVTCLALSADNDTLTFRCQEGLHVCSISTGEVRALLPEYFEVIRTATGYGTKSGGNPDARHLVFARRKYFGGMGCLRPQVLRYVARPQTAAQRSPNFFSVAWHSHQTGRLI